MQDFFRKSITPEYTDIQRVDRDRVRGIVEFATREDLKRAIRDLDGATLIMVVPVLQSKQRDLQGTLHHALMCQGMTLLEVGICIACQDLPAFCLGPDSNVLAWRLLVPFVERAAGRVVCSSPQVPGAQGGGSTVLSDSWS